MKQYEIRWANLPSPIGRRPVLILSRTAAAEYLSRVLVVEVTTKIRAIPQEMKLGRAEGLSRVCVANFDNVQTLALQVIGAKMGAVSDARHREVKRAMGFVLEWPELIDLET
jgi:mRNA interferase MazF